METPSSLRAEQDGLAGPSTVRTSETIPPPLEDGEDRDGGLSCFQVPLLEMKGLFLHFVSFPPNLTKDVEPNQTLNPTNSAAR